MEEKLMSKKELLEKTGISYGQLYRWKRKNIIPEEWFIKKSSYTGQETFFPEEKILERVNKIKSMKDDMSLEEMAEMFSTKAAGFSVTMDEAVDKGAVSSEVAKLYKELGGKESFFEDILGAYIAYNFLSSGEITMDEGKSLMKIFIKHKSELKDYKYSIMLLRKMGTGIWILGDLKNGVFTEDDAKVVIKRDLPLFVEELKLKLK